MTLTIAREWKGWVVAVATIYALGSASAAEQSPEDRQVAELYQKSTAAYQSGRFEEAATLLREIYRRRPDPVLLYNLGRAMEGIGDLRGAIDAYQRYLGSAAQISDRPAIEQRVNTLSLQLEEKAALLREREALRTEREAAEARLAVVAQPPAPSKPVYKRWWLWTTVAGVALAGAGIGIGVWRSKQVSPAPTQATDFGTRSFP